MSAIWLQYEWIHERCQLQIANVMDCAPCNLIWHLPGSYPKRKTVSNFQRLYILRVYEIWWLGHSFPFRKAYFQGRWFICLVSGRVYTQMHLNTINNDRDIQQSIHVLGWGVTVIHSKLNNTFLLTAVTPTSKNAVSPLDFKRFHITLELELIHLRQQNLPSYFNWLYVNIIFENGCYSRWEEPSNTCPFAAAVGIPSVLLYDLFLCWAKTLEDVSKNTKK